MGEYVKPSDWNTGLKSITTVSSSIDAVTAECRKHIKKCYYHKKQRSNVHENNFLVNSVNTVRKLSPFKQDISLSE